MDQLRIEEQNGSLLIYLSGEITMEIITQLKEEVEKVITEKDSQTIIFDMSETSFMDSSAISLLVLMNMKLSDSNKKMILRKPSKQVMKILEMVEMGDYFQTET